MSHNPMNGSISGLTILSVLLRQLVEEDPNDIAFCVDSDGNITSASQPAKENFLWWGVTGLTTRHVYILIETAARAFFAHDLKMREDFIRQQYEAWAELLAGKALHTTKHTIPSHNGEWRRVTMRFNRIPGDGWKEQSYVVRIETRQLKQGQYIMFKNDGQLLHPLPSPLAFDEVILPAIC